MTIIGKAFGVVSVVLITVLLVSSYFRIKDKVYIGELEKKLLMAETNNITLKEAIKSQNEAVEQVATLYTENIKVYENNTNDVVMSSFVNKILKDTDEKLTKCENIEIVLDAIRTNNF